MTSTSKESTGIRHLITAGRSALGGMLLFAAACDRIDDDAATTHTDEFAALETWTTYGHGAITSLPDGDGLLLDEAEDSVGLMLISTETRRGDVRVAFDFKPLNEASVGVVLLNVREPDTGPGLPAEYDGAGQPWVNGPMPNYFFAFHNAAHDRRPFVARHPPRHTLFEATSDPIRVGAWNRIEAERIGNTLRFTVNGDLLYEVDDPEPLVADGRIAFRLRGTAETPASAKIRRVHLTP